MYIRVAVGGLFSLVIQYRSDCCLDRTQHDKQSSKRFPRMSHVTCHIVQFIVRTVKPDVHGSRQALEKIYWYNSILDTAVYHTGIMVLRGSK
jgi:hypothetical protein